MVEADVLQNDQSTDVCADSIVTETDLSKAVPYLIILSVCSILEVITKLLPQVVSWGRYTPLFIDIAVIFGYVYAFTKLKSYSKYFGILVYVAVAAVILQEVNSELYYNLYVKIPLYISVQAFAIAKYKLISDGFVEMLKTSHPDMGKHWRSFWYYVIVFYAISIIFVLAAGWIHPSHYIDYSWIIPFLLVNILVAVPLIATAWVCRRRKSITESDL